MAFLQNHMTTWNKHQNSALKIKSLLEQSNLCAWHPGVTNETKWAIPHGPLSDWDWALVGKANRSTYGCHVKVENTRHREREWTYGESRILMIIRTYEAILLSIITTNIAIYHHCSLHVHSYHDASKASWINLQASPRGNTKEGLLLWHLLTSKMKKQIPPGYVKIAMENGHW